MVDIYNVYLNDDTVIELTFEVLGTYLNVDITADPIEITVTQHGEYLENVFIEADPIEISVELSDVSSIFGVTVVTAQPKKNWVCWSDIGSMDFTIGRDNVAGEMPMDWKGWVYEVKKLKSNVVVYGQNGITILKPVDNKYGLNTILRTGLLSRGAVGGNDEVHYFIDNLGRLWELSDQLNKLDYSEYLADLSTTKTTLSFDTDNLLLYICDGTLGFVYSPADKSLGKGPVNVTGIASQSGTTYVTASSTIEIPEFEMWTDIIDMNTRKSKTIETIEVGTNLTEVMEVCVEYRNKKEDEFERIPWSKVTPSGFSYVFCTGVEFRVGLKMYEYEYFELDRLQINGWINDK